MYVTDPIADMLTRLRNASQAGLMYSMVPASRLKVEVAKILESEGFIRGFRLVRDGRQGKIKVALKYTDSGEPAIRGIERVSRPGRRVYMRVDKLARRQGSMGVAVLSTSKGIMSDTSARAERVGGEVLANVW